MREKTIREKGRETLLLTPQLSVNLLLIKWSSMWNPLMLRMNEVMKIKKHIFAFNGKWFLKKTKVRK